MTFPVITVFYYIAFALIVFAGGSRAAKGTCNSEFLSPRATKSLQGFAAIGVLSHHLAQREIFEKQLGEIQAFTYIGFLFVGIFFFVSGYGLIKSLDTKPNYLDGFLKKRCVPILVTYYVMNAFCIIWHLLLGTKMSASEWICKITGVALLNDNAWFVPVILIMYLAFYFIFKNVKNRKTAFALIFLVVAAQIGWFLFNKHFPWWLGEKDWWKGSGLWTAPWWKKPVALWYEGEWWVNSTICFFVGMLVAQNEKKFFEFFSKFYWIKFAAVFTLAAVFMWQGLWANTNISYWREFGPNPDNTTLPRLQMITVQTLQVIFFVLFIVVFMMKFFADNKITRWFGKYSLEIYLMQVIPIRTIPNFIKFENMDMTLFSSRMWAFLYIVLVIAISILLAIVLKWCSAKVLKLVGYNKK